LAIRPQLSGPRHATPRHATPQPHSTPTLPHAQEYNICFTTVQRPQDGSIPPLPSVGGAGPAAMAPLPLVIQGLVHERRKVKAQMKGAKSPAEFQRLNIQQQVGGRGWL
jgi:hypothetical protein